LDSPEVFARQEQLVRYLVRELNGFDNLLFELQNEPWADLREPVELLDPHKGDRVPNVPNQVEIPKPESVEWQRAIARVIVDEESRLPHRHLIAQNINNICLPLRDSDLVPEAGIINFHYARSEAVTWNRGLDRVIGFDESGFAGTEDATYRRQAWEFLMAGGGLFNSLDYSFSVGFEDGSDLQPKSPGGGSRELRRQLKVLSDFLHRFDLSRLQPDYQSVIRASGVVARCLSVPGHQYAIYLWGRSPAELSLNLPAGSYGIQWIHVVSGDILAANTLEHPGGPCRIQSPEFALEIALEVRRKP
jgi:hypothetical protein